MNIKNIFKVDPTIGVSKFRIYLLRFYYALNFVALVFKPGVKYLLTKVCGSQYPESHIVFGLHFPY